MLSHCGFALSIADIGATSVEYVDASKATRSATAARGGSPFVDDWVPGSAAPSHLYENGHVSNVPHGHVALEDEGARVPSEGTTATVSFET